MVCGFWGIPDPGAEVARDMPVTTCQLCEKASLHGVVARQRLMRPRVTKHWPLDRWSYNKKIARYLERVRGISSLQCPAYISRGSIGPEWRNGRRNGLKIRRGQPHESSTLSSGI